MKKTLCRGMAEGLKKGGYIYLNKCNVQFGVLKRIQCLFGLFRTLLLLNQWQ